MTPVRSAFLVLVGIGLMLAIASTGPVGDLLGPKLGPKCRKACTYPKGDMTKWEVVCQECCDELRRGSRCYADCAKGKLPPECKQTTTPDTGCEER